MKTNLKFNLKGGFPAFSAQKNMILLLLLAIFSFFSLQSPATYAQGSDEDAIKKVIKAESMGYYNRDATAWQNTWVQDAKSTRTLIFGWYEEKAGWENFGPQMVKSIKDNPKKIPVNLDTKNYIIHSNGDLAWVEYDQIITAPSVDPELKEITKEKRALVKKDGQWKIITQITYAPELFANTPEAIERNLNSTGYKLMSAKKVKEAIEVFKLNVQLYPQSANAFDSLGEAYAADGNTKMAIKNYEKAIELNPKNENAKTALAKLK